MTLPFTGRTVILAWVIVNRVNTVESDVKSVRPTIIVPKETQFAATPEPLTPTMPPERSLTETEGPTGFKARKTFKEVT